MNLSKTYISDSDDATDGESLNDIVLHGYSLMGKVAGGLGAVEVEAREIVIPARHLVLQSVRIELTSAGDYPQIASGTIQYQNVDQYLSVLDRLETTNISRDRFAFTEVQYEIDDVKTVVFNNDRGELMWMISTGGVSVHYQSLTTIARLKKLIEQAKFHLESTKI